MPAWGGNFACGKCFQKFNGVDNFVALFNKVNFIFYKVNFIFDKVDLIFHIFQRGEKVPKNLKRGGKNGCGGIKFWEFFKWGYRKFS